MDVPRVCFNFKTTPLFTLFRPVLEISLGLPTIESKIRKNYINFDHLELFLSPQLFGPPTMVTAVFDFKDWTSSISYNCTLFRTDFSTSGPTKIKHCI